MPIFKGCQRGTSASLGLRPPNQDHLDGSVGKCLGDVPYQFISCVFGRFRFTSSKSTMNKESLSEVAAVVHVVAIVNVTQENIFHWQPWNVVLIWLTIDLKESALAHSFMRQPRSIRCLWICPYLLVVPGMGQTMVLCHDLPCFVLNRPWFLLVCLSGV